MYDKEKKDQKKESVHKGMRKDDPNYENYGKSKDMKKDKK